MDEEQPLTMQEIAEGIKDELTLLNMILLKKFNYEVTDDGDIVDK